MILESKEESEELKKFRASIAESRPITKGDFSNLNKNQKETLKKQEKRDGKVVIERKGEDEDEEKTKEVMVYKYSNNGKDDLYESIILNGLPCFIMYDKEKDNGEGGMWGRREIKQPGRTLRPPRIDECPFPPYEFETMNELKEYIRRAKGIKSIADLFNASKHFWKMYVDQDKEIVNMLAADTILTYFQDLFPVIHYDECVGGNDVGKSSIGYTMQYTAYRPVKGTSISGANYYRIFGTVEPGQCIIIEDEGDSISDDPEKVRILKAGYEYNEKVPKTNKNTEKQEMSWFFVYAFKMILAEKSLRQLKAKGLVDRTCTMKCRPGKVKYSIKDVVSDVINKAPNLVTLYKELLDFRKLLLCYKLIHYKDALPRIKVDLENRDKELMYPLLQLFYGSSAFPEVKEAVEFFVKQRRERKSRSLDAALYPIIKSEIGPNPNDGTFKDPTNIPILFSKIWGRVIAGDDIEGSYDEKRKNEYDTKEYGKLYISTLSLLISDVFGANIKHTNKGSELTFNLDKFKSFESRYEKVDMADLKINVELESDGSDGCDGSGYALGGYCHNFNNIKRDMNKVAEGSSLSATPSPPSPPSPISQTSKIQENYNNVLVPKNLHNTQIRQTGQLGQLGIERESDGTQRQTPSPDDEDEDFEEFNKRMEDEEKVSSRSLKSSHTSHSNSNTKIPRYDLKLIYRDSTFLNKLQNRILDERKHNGKCLTCGEILLTDPFFRKIHRCEYSRSPKDNMTKDHRTVVI